MVPLTEGLIVVEKTMENDAEIWGDGEFKDDLWLIIVESMGKSWLTMGIYSG